MRKKNSLFINFLGFANSFSGHSRALSLSASLVAIFTLAACSSVPNTVNPAEWYKKTVNLIAGEGVQKKESDVRSDQEKNLTSEKQTNKIKEILSGQGKIPKLSSVPKRPKTSIVKGLVPDNRKRRYAKPIERQGEASQMMAQQTPRLAPKQQQVPVETKTQKAPPAMPAAPVTSAPIAKSITATEKPTPTSIAKPARPAMTYSSIQPKKFNLSPPQTTASLAQLKPLKSIVDDPFTTVVVSSDGVSVKSTTANADVSSQAQKISNSRAFTPVSQQAAEPSGTKVATILFKAGSSGLNESDRKIIGQVVQLHKQRGGKITVVGHASSRTRNMDPVNHKMVNYGVSVDRADRIANELKKMGLAPESIIVDARSDSMPLYHEVMPSGEAGNRRAEIYFNN